MKKNIRHYTGTPAKTAWICILHKYFNAIEDSMTEQQFGWKILAPLTEKIHCGHTSFGMSKGYNKWVSNKIIPFFSIIYEGVE